MELKKFWKRYENQILASVLILGLLLFVGMRYDYYFDLNDDVQMKDILAGVYTGVPEGHNIQMLYPLSLGISWLYRLFPNAPVYGLFLCVCQYLSLWIFAERSLRFRTSTLSKIGMLAVEGITMVTMLLPHLVFVQYTFVCAMLAGAATFWFITSKSLPAGKFICSNIPAILLAVLAYMLRTEMLLLLFPLLCVAGLYHWSVEEKIWKMENFIKYFSVLGAILAGILLTTGIHEHAFGGEDWKNYVAYFDSRTQLYDYQGIPAYEGNEALYEELELTAAEQHMLLEQYNFGLEDTLEAEDLDRIASYQKEQKAQSRSWIAQFIEKTKLYVYRTFHKEPTGSAVEDDYPWNVMVVLGYMAVFIMIMCSRVEEEEQLKDKLFSGAGKLAFLFAVRTALWMFILMGGRDPVRITHSLYLLEFWILLGMLHMEGRQMDAQIGGKVRVTIVFPIIFGLTMVCSLSQVLAETDTEYEYRAAANVVDAGMKAYCRSNPDKFYFFDVYSAVSYPLEPYLATPYSEKMFVDVNNTLGNYDIMGGWQVKSPSYEEKLAVFGMDSMRDGFLYQENVYMMAELAKGTDYIKEYFADQNIEVQVQLTDEICDIIGVYKIEVAAE